MKQKGGDGSLKGLEAVFQALNETLTRQITTLIPGFHRYHYDFNGGAWNQIADGGGDMFDGGNMVTFKVGANQQRMVYGETYKLPLQQVEAGSKTGHPFFALMWISN